MTPRDDLRALADARDGIIEDLVRLGAFKANSNAAENFRVIVDNRLRALAAAQETPQEPKDADDWDIGGRIVKKHPDGSWTIDSRDGNRRRVQFLCFDCGRHLEAHETPAPRPALRESVRAFLYPFKHGTRPWHELDEAEIVALIDSLKGD